jgi:UDP-glucose 4-epimerase
MRALVSGGAGFIGSTLADALLDRGHEVIVDDLSTGREANLTRAMSAGAKRIPADIRDARSLHSIFGVHRPQLVFHLAAQVDVRISISDPGRDVRVNVEGTVNMLDAARRAGAQSFVFASSCAVYGDPFNRRRLGVDAISTEAFPLTEDASARPDAPYGQGKLGAEGYVALVSGGRPTIYGDGTQTRDFLFVDDAVAALLAAGDSSTGGEFNIGTGVETTVLDVAEKLRRLGARDDFQPDNEGAIPGEIRRMALCSDLAQAELGWRPEVQFDDGLVRTLGGLSADGGALEGAGGTAPPASDSVQG